jgi:hypothetical protein
MQRHRAWIARSPRLKFAPKKAELRHHSPVRNPLDRQSCNLADGCVVKLRGLHDRRNAGSSKSLSVLTSVVEEVERVMPG